MYSGLILKYLFMCLYLLQVDELQNSIEDEQKSIADELRAIAEEKMSIEESGGASDAMAVD